MNVNLNLLLIIFLVISLILLTFLLLKPSRHRINISSAGQVLKLISTFEGDYKEGRIFSYLRKIKPYVFEELLLNVFKVNGFEIERNKRYTHDGGLDGKVYKDGKMYLIQAKRYKGYVKAVHLREFQQCIEKNKAKGGFFIHTGKSGKEKLSIYRNTNVEIISGDRLIKFIKSVK